MDLSRKLETLKVLFVRYGGSKESKNIHNYSVLNNFESTGVKVSTHDITLQNVHQREYALAFTDLYKKILVVVYYLMSLS